MDENTLFQPQNLNQGESGYQPQPQAQPQVPNIQVPPPPPLPPEDNSSSGFPLMKIAKLLIGFLVVLFFAVIVFTVIIPFFTKNNNQKVTLTYWGLWEDSRIMQAAISDFQRQYPNITVNYSKQDIKQYKERLVTRINNGNGPDIFRFHNSWYPMLSGILLPLPSDTISKSDFSKWFYPVMQKDLIKNGAIYGVPLHIDTLGLYVNSDAFSAAGLKPPTNWNDFISDSKTLTVKDADGKIKTAGAAMGTFDNVNHAPDILSLLLVQNGVVLSNMASNPQRVTDALNFYTSFALGGASVWDSTLDTSLLAFTKGNLAMYFGYSWDYFAIKAANPNLNFQVVPVPQLPNNNVNLASYWAEGASVKSKHKKETLLFMKFLANKNTQDLLYSEEAKTRSFGELYSRVDLADKLKDNAYVYPFIQQAKTAVSSFFVDGTFDNGLNTQMNTYLGNAVNSIFNNVSAETAADTLFQGVSQVLKQYGQ
ncbi:MAG: sugar ABC transporter substrate-binding protein [Patescibacteria group bacterium]|nr:sugar ABC transporter substrate-binding protein [Patescibacteria group bacterium]